MSSSKDNGFTLVEMLVTLAIVGVVFALLSSVIGFGRDVLGKTAGDSAGLDEVALTKRLLSDTLSQVIVTDQTRLVGTANKLSAVAYGPQALGLAGPTETTFEPYPDGRGLQVKWAAAGGGQEVVHRILNAESEVTFSYFSPDRGWTVGWENSSSLPDLVRIYIRRDSDSLPTELSVRVEQVESPSCFIRAPGRCAASR